MAKEKENILNFFGDSDKWTSFSIENDVAITKKNIGRKNKLAATDITLYKYCPRQYYNRHILGLRFEENESMIRGTLLHQLYREFFERKLFAEENANYFRWFLTTGIEKIMDRESRRIDKLSLNYFGIRKFLVENAQNLQEAFKQGRVSLPSQFEQRIENDKFIARIDTIFEDEEKKIGDLKIRLRDIDEVKLQIAVAAMIFESIGKNFEKGVVINAQEWQELEFPITQEDKKEVNRIRDKILEMHETKEKPECICGRCE